MATWSTSSAGVKPTARGRNRQKPQEMQLELTSQPSQRLTMFDQHAHLILGASSAGSTMTPGMRLVALCLLQWHEEVKPKRLSMTTAFLRQRTSLPLEHIEAILPKLQAINLAAPSPNGWELTINQFKATTLKKWALRQ